MSLAVFGAACLLLFVVSSAFASDPGLPDSLTIDSVVVYLGDDAVIPVRFVNDENLSAIEVTLKENAPDYAVDSFTLVGGRLQGFGFSGTTINSNGSITLFVAATSTLISPGSGLLGYLHLSRPVTQTPTLITIDTNTIVIGQIERSTSFTADGVIQSFKPIIRRGYLEYKSAPTSVDSVWVDSVSAVRGGVAEVAVFLENAEQLATVSIALMYDSDDLTFDSISFQNSRIGSPIGLSTVYRDDDNSLIVIAQYDESLPLLVESGVFFRLFFRVSMTATAPVVMIDSTTFAPGAGTYVELFPGDGGGRFIPRFSQGKVAIDLLTDVGDESDLLPDQFVLEQNYPNPFNPTTSIEFALPASSDVRLELFNTLGQSVTLLLDQRLSAGRHTVIFDATSARGGSLASGVYFYRLTTEMQTATKSLLLLK